MNAKPNHSLRHRPAGQGGKISLLLPLAVAALFLVLGGCGGLNDDPAGGGLSVRFGFADSNDGSSTEASAQSSPDTAEPMLSSPAGTEVLSIVIGAIVITHEKVSGNGIEPYTIDDVFAGIGESQRALLESDLEQSIVFMEIVQLPTDDDSVEFPIPPDNAGKWQLLAVGMRHRIESLGDIDSNSPIYYGFIGRFLNGEVTPGDEISEDLKLIAACAIADPPKPPC